MLLPGLPLVNRPGENPEPNLWTFDIEIPHLSSGVTVAIDYVHPGNGDCDSCCFQEHVTPCFLFVLTTDEFIHLCIPLTSEWRKAFRDKSWRRFSDTEILVDPHLYTSSARIKTDSQPAVADGKLT